MAVAEIDQGVKLSMGARALYRAMCSYPSARSKWECYAGQKQLALSLGCSVDSIRRYLRQLADEGLIQVERRGLTKTNLYRILSPEAANCTIKKPQIAASGNGKLHDQETANCGFPTLYEPLELEDNSSSKQGTPAVAAIETTPENPPEPPPKPLDELTTAEAPPNAATSEAERLAKAYEAEGLPPWLGQYAARHGHAEEVILHYRERCADPKARKVLNPVGYVKGCLNHPGDYGFTRDGPQWRRPPPSADAEKVLRRAELAQKAKEQSRQEWTERDQAKEAAEEWWALWNGRWESLAESKQAEFEAIVRAKSPLFAGRESGGYLVRSMCLRHLEAVWHEQSTHR